MPELPEVENQCRFLRRYALHKKILGATASSPKLLRGVSSSELSRKLEGRSLVAANRHGKHLFASVDEGHSLAIHFGMTGRFVYFKADEPEPKHDRLRIDFRGKEHLGFVDQRMFGRIEWIEETQAFIRQKELGPDALGTDEKTFRARLRAKHGALKSALMDQSVIAGIGNIYSDEILFQARLHPKTQTSDLDEKAFGRLYRKMTKILEAAIDKGAGTEDSEGWVPPSWLLAHRKKNADCPRCGSKVSTLKLQGRTAYFCPNCQSQPPLG